MEASQTSSESILFLSETDKCVDCRFLVGIEPDQEIITGNKSRFATASPVFERMFYGPLPEKSDPIPIPDVQPEAFRTMTEFIYTDKINITSLDKASELYYVASKYMLRSVVDACSKYICSELCPNNVCWANEFGKLFNANELIRSSFELITTKTQEVLAVKEIDITSLLIIFDHNLLNIESELDLFKALHKYATDRGYLDQQKTGSDDEKAVIPYDDSNPDHELINKALRKIRFLTLTPQQFAEGPANSKLLSKSEALSILMSITCPDMTLPEGFSHSRISRNISGSQPLRRLYCYCTTNTHKPMQWNHSTGTEVFTISFEVNTSILITGFQISTNMITNGFKAYLSELIKGYKEDISAELLADDGSVLTSTEFTSLVNYNSSKEISFETPAWIQCNKLYTIKAAFKKVGCCYTMYNPLRNFTYKKDDLKFIFADNTMKNPIFSIGFLRE